MRLIAGNAFGLGNNVKTNSPLFYLHVVLEQGARFGLPMEHSERGFYIVKGSVEVSGVTYNTVFSYKVSRVRILLRSLEETTI